MPPNPISAGLRAIAGVTGPLLQSSLQFGRGAGVLWQTYRAAYDQLEIAAPPANVADMSRFQARLGGLVRSVQEFARSSDETVLVASHIAPPLAETMGEANLGSPTVIVTFQALVETEEGLVPMWQSTAYHGIFPTTVGQIRDEALQSAQITVDQAPAEEADRYPVTSGTVVGLGQMYATGWGWPA